MSQTKYILSLDPRRSLYFSCGACTISTEYVCAEQESDRQSR